MLSNLYHDKYMLKEVESKNEDIHTFLCSLYELKPKKYFDLYKTIDKVSKITWWNDIIQNNGSEIKKAFSQHQL